MGQIVQMAYGKANFPSTLATWACQKVTAPFVRVSGVTAGVRRGQPHHQQCGAIDQHGGIVTQQVEHENGTILMLTASWKRGGMPIKDAAIFIKLRGTGPHWRIMAKVPLSDANRIGETALHFMGHGDILNESDLAVSGLEVPRQWRSRFMQLEEVEECYELTMLSPETAARAQLSAISTETGVVVREIAAMPNRRLRFGKRG